MANDNWFSADKNGLRQIGERLVERRGYGILGGELYQNVADTKATTCDITIQPIAGVPQVDLCVTDNNPSGFTDLAHAWTLFAPSEKKGDPTKAGRFNLGEKMVLAFCRRATIITTSGSVSFDENGRIETKRRKTEVGTVFRATLDCTRERYEQLIDYFDKIIVRPGLELKVNGNSPPTRTPIHTFEVQLPTEIGDDLRATVRKTVVEVYEPAGSETPMLYELGIPVVETGDKWHINVMQKVPLNVDRDNVTPAYLQKVRVAVVNEMHRFLDEEDTTSTWVTAATEDRNCSKEAIETFLDARYGKRRAALDPLNPDANAAALTSGYTVIPSRGLNPGQRENAKAHGLLVSTSAAFPTAGKGAYSDNPNAKPVMVLSEGNYTPGMTLMKQYAIALAYDLMGIDLQVRIVHCDTFLGDRWLACYRPGSIDFNVFTLGKKWFDQGPTVKVNSLLIHEFAHEKVSNHASDEFHDECCELGAKLAELVLRKHSFFVSMRDQFERQLRQPAKV
jgi:hypothetical protein